MKLTEVGIKYHDGEAETYQAKKIQIKDWVQVEGPPGMGVKFFASARPVLKMQLLDDSHIVIEMSSIKKIHTTDREVEVQGVPVEGVQPPGSKDKKNKDEKE